MSSDFRVPNSFTVSHHGREYIIRDGFRAASESHLIADCKNNLEDRICLDRYNFTEEDVITGVDYLNGEDVHERENLFEVGVKWKIGNLIYEGRRGREWEAIEALESIGKSAEIIERELAEMMIRGEEVGTGDSLEMFERVLRKGEEIGMEEKMAIKVIAKSMKKFGKYASPLLEGKNIEEEAEDEDLELLKKYGGREIRERSRDEIQRRYTKRIIEEREENHRREIEEMKRENEMREENHRREIEKIQRENEEKTRMFNEKIKIHEMRIKELSTILEREKKDISREMEARVGKINQSVSRQLKSNIIQTKNEMMSKLEESTKSIRRDQQIEIGLVNSGMRQWATNFGLREQIRKVNESHVLSVKYDPNNNFFKGLMNSIQEMTGKWITDTGIVSITASSVFGGIPEYLTHYNEMYQFTTNDEENSSITFTFNNSEIKLSGYQIHSNLGGNPGWHLKSWVIEGKAAGGSKWIELNRQTDCEYLNDRGAIHYFEVRQSAPMKEIRLRITGPNWSGINEIWLNLIEFYGEMINLTIPDADNRIQVFNNRLSLLGDHEIVAMPEHSQSFNGIFYRMGKDLQKHIKITSSKSSYGEPLNLLSPKWEPWETSDPYERWVQIDFLAGYVEITSYSLRHIFHPEFYMIGWKLEGQKTSGEWINLNEVNESDKLNGWGQIAMFNLPQRSPPVKAIKLSQIGPNSKDDNEMYLGRLEIFGSYHF